MSGVISPLLFGVAIGVVVGATVLLTNFCALGAVADIVFAKDWRRMRAWMLAGAVAIFGAQFLDTLGLIDLAGSTYASPFIQWLPIILGGLCFGFGMALAGGCISRALTRVGAGSLKSLVTVMVIGIVAAMTSSGILTKPTDALFAVGMMHLDSSNSLIAILGAATGGDQNLVRWTLTALIGGGLLIFCIKDTWFRTSRSHVIAGIVIGLCITAAWATGIIAHASGERGADGINFVAPMASLMIALTNNDMPSFFPVAVVVGVPLGSLIAGAFTRNLAWESFTDAADLPRHLIGGALMGFGGTLSLGCTFGQGLSGLSTLAVGSLLAIAAMWFGCLWGIRYFEAGSVWGGLVLAIKRRMH